MIPILLLWHKRAFQQTDPCASVATRCHDWLGREQMNKFEQWCPMPGGGLEGSLYSDVPSWGACTVTSNASEVMVTWDHSLDRQTDRHTHKWKHYFPTTSLTGANKCSNVLSSWVEFISWLINILLYFSWHSINIGYTRVALVGLFLVIISKNTCFFKKNYL